jgi:hypothetical protein
MQHSAAMAETISCQPCSTLLHEPPFAVRERIDQTTQNSEGLSRHHIRPDGTPKGTRIARPTRGVAVTFAEIGSEQRPTVSGETDATKVCQPGESDSRPWSHPECGSDHE